MTFDDAIAAHRQWSARLAGIVAGVFAAGEAEPALVGRDDACVLGEWLVRVSTHLAAHPGFARVVATHARFHLLAAEVVTASGEGDRRRAQRLLEAGEDYARASSELVALLRHLGRTFESPTRAPSGKKTTPARNHHRPHGSRKAAERSEAPGRRRT